MRLSCWIAVNAHQCISDCHLASAVTEAKDGIMIAQLDKLKKKEVEALNNG